MNCIVAINMVPKPIDTIMIMSRIYKTIRKPTTLKMQKCTK